MKRLSRPRRSVLVVAVAALLFGAPTVYAASSFVGRGMVTFDAITVGKNDKDSKIYLQGPVSNPGKNVSGSGKSVRVADDLSVDGSLAVTKAATFKAPIKAPNLTVTGGMDSNGVDVFKRLNENQTATNALYDFVSCLHDLSSGAGYVATDDITVCWNIWISGQVSNPPVP